MIVLFWEKQAIRKTRTQDQDFGVAISNAVGRQIKTHLQKYLTKKEI